MHDSLTPGAELLTAWGAHAARACNGDSKEGGPVNEGHICPAVILPEAVVGLQMVVSGVSVLFRAQRRYRLYAKLVRL